MGGTMTDDWAGAPFRDALTTLHVSVAAAFLLLSVFGIRRWRTAKVGVIQGVVQPGKTEKKHEIEALEGFDWKHTEPRKLRPYKPKYNITMGLQADSPSNLIVVDKNYAERVSLRRSLLRDHPSTVHGHIPPGRPAIRELYTFLLSTYLPARYPSMFRLSSSGDTFHNLVTGAEFPTTPPEDMSSALGILCETVEDDLFLLRETDEGPHIVDAFVCCFPAGFDPSEKLGLLLKDVHGPVPSYEKIGASMERFFGRLETGKSVKRMNWSVQTHGVLFNPKAHTKPEDEITDEDVSFQMDQTYARMELQTLTRLPETRAILFSFKTYLYRLSDMKADGEGPGLADAIEGLKAGNAPGMWIYKGGGKWAERVCEYLRS